MRRWKLENLNEEGGTLRDCEAIAGPILKWKINAIETKNLWKGAQSSARERSLTSSETGRNRVSFRW
jgi:hypothetical protein